MSAPAPQNQAQTMNNPNINSGNIDNPMPRCASQSSFDERPEKRIRRDTDLAKPSYRNHNHADRAFSVINTMRKQNFFCDVVLQAHGGFEIQAHKMILASCSPYFNAMFADFKERDQQRIQLQEINPSALKLLVEYIYTSEIFLTEENVQILLPAANLLQLIDVRDACCEFLQTQLQPSNCWKIQTFANNHGCQKLLKYVDDYIKSHLSEVIEANEFLALSEQQIVNLISSDRLEVSSEETIYECLRSWLYADLENRRGLVPKLMEYIRLPLLSREYLVERVKGEPLFTESFQCQSLLIEALSYHLLGNEQRKAIRTLKTTPRRGAPKVLLVIGGWGIKEGLRSVECYDLEDEKWYKGSKLPSERSDAASSVFDDRIYIIGGKTGCHTLRTVDVYDRLADRWLPCAEMKTCRESHGAAALGNYIYAVGGYDGTNFLNSVEAYDPKANEWRVISPMIVARDRAGVGVIKNLLYAVGGLGLSSVECYNPENDKWKPVADMSVRRSGVGVGVLDGILYAIGGCNSLTLKSAEAYNPETNQWKPIADMSCRRKNAGVVACNGLLFVVGGEDETRTHLTSVEVYSPRYNSWTILNGSMSSRRSRTAVAIIDRSLAIRETF